MKLAAAVFFLLISAWISVTYTSMSHIRLIIEHGDDSSLPPFAYLMFTRGNFAYGLPVITLIFGSIFLRFLRDSLALFEAVIQCSWLIGIVLPLLCVLFWQIANIPTVSGGRAHY